MKSENKVIRIKNHLSQTLILRLEEDGFYYTVNPVTTHIYKFNKVGVVILYLHINGLDDRAITEYIDENTIAVMKPNDREIREFRSYLLAEKF